MRRIAGVVFLCFAIAAPSIGTEPAYLVGLRQYLALTPGQMSLLRESNRIYARFMVDRDRQIADLAAQKRNPQHTLLRTTLKTLFPVPATKYPDSRHKSESTTWRY